MTQPWVSPDLITRRATGSSTVLRPLFRVQDLFSVKFCSLISKRNTRRSEPDADPEEGSPADIIESLASPSWRPQRLRPALGNQRIRNTHTLDVHVPSRLRGEEITSGASSVL